MSRARILTSAACVVFVNGKPYSQVSGFSWHSSTPKKEIQGLDQMEASELAPTTARAGFALELYRVKGSASARGAGMVGTWTELPREKYFSLIIIDRESDLIVFRADECSSEDEKWNIPAKSFVTGSLSCKCISWSDECQAV